MRDDNRIIIIGGGMAGLGCGLGLGRPLLLLEEEADLGGLAGCYRVGDSAVEKYYHHFFHGDMELFTLIDRLGLTDRLEWLRSSVGYRVGGENYRLNTPLEVLRFPHLSLREKIALGKMVRYARGIDNLSQYDDVPAVDWVVDVAGQAVYERFFRALLRLKWGERYRDISAAWLINRMTIRSHRSLKGERLAYLCGGWSQVLEGMARLMTSRGGEIRRGVPVRRIVIEGDVVRGVETDEGFEPADVVVATVAVSGLVRLTREDPGLPIPSYQGTTCLLLGLKRRLLDGIYWLNLEEGLPFGAVIEHTNFVPPSEYGCHLVYLVTYHNRSEGVQTSQDDTRGHGARGSSAWGSRIQDSGVRDAGARDTGAGHSGARDTGAGDSGTPDSSAGDSAVRDTGARDSSARDSSSRDSSARDGSARDAGVRSSGIRDGSTRHSGVQPGSAGDIGPPDGTDIADMGDGEVAETFIDGLGSMVPHLKRSDIVFWHLARTEHSSPHYVVGYAAHSIVPYRTRIRGLYAAGMASPPSYPERSLCASLRAGYECAEAIARDLSVDSRERSDLREQAVSIDRPSCT